MRCCPTFHKHLFTQDEELSTSEDEAFVVGLNNNICLFDTCIFGRDNSLEKLSIITNGRTADPSRGNIKYRYIVFYRKNILVLIVARNSTFYQIWYQYM